jgi:cell wall-associated NlpC family hydrolase
VRASLQALVLRQVPWCQGGLDPTTGLGCYGLVVLAFAQSGIALPPTAEEGHACFTIIPPPYQPFDVMLARLSPEPTARHVGLFVASTWGFHCSWLTNGVARFAIDQGPWRRWFRHGLRWKGFLPCT